MEWIKNPKRISSEIRLELCGEIEDDGHWIHAVVKYDGDVDLFYALKKPFSDKNGQYNQRESDSVTKFHICDTELLIKQLQELREMAISHFGENEWWEPRGKK